MKNLRLIACIGIQLISTAAYAMEMADTPPHGDQPETVSINDLRNPELFSYRAVMAGLDAFDKHHQLAPDAPLVRFYLKPRSDREMVNFDGVSLSIRGNETSIGIPVASDGSFSIPRNQAAYDDDAELVLNQKKGVFQGRIEVRSASIPADMRRLGDLRLECEVNMAIARKTVGFLARIAMGVVTMVGDACESKRFRFGFSASETLAGVTLVSGERRATLSADVSGFSGKHYFPPLWDKSWSDDTLIQFQYPASASKMPPN
jgi:hypothetical protein